MKEISPNPPLDYMEGLESCVRGAVEKAGRTARKYVKGISVDTTGSTPCPVTQEGIPLALLQGFEENPNAMFHLWKDHTVVQEAEEINYVASEWSGEDYTKVFWLKVLKLIILSPLEVSFRNHRL